MGRLDELKRATALAAVTLATLAGCGEDDETGGFPVACNDSVPAVQDALRGAPARVALTGGTKLSTCVERARTGADIQTVGALYTATADDLAAKLAGSDAAALRLGYLVGATRRGASRTSGIHDELVRRLEQSTGLDGAPPARRAAYRRGLAAGRRLG
jgi:hypothetical protein